MTTRRTYSNETKDLFRQHKADWKTLLWISDALKISFNTIKVWSMKIAHWDDLSDKRELNGKQKTFSDEALKQYVDTHPNDTLWNIGDFFGVSDVAILKRLRSVNYSYKKKRWRIKNETNKSELSSEGKLNTLLPPKE
jgi:hypothetical protein